MIGDIIRFKEEYFNTSKSILHMLDEQMSWRSIPKFVIGIGGESGSGKSVTAFSLQKLFSEMNINSFIFHIDDYFKLPPLSNHQARIEDIEKTGLGEVNFEWLESNILDFKNGKSSIVKPLVYYKENTIGEEEVLTSKIQVLIVEGTYVLKSDFIDFGVFMDRDYNETKAHRHERARDELSDFVEKVLAIEHTIIRSLKPRANCIVLKDYSLQSNSKS